MGNDFQVRRGVKSGRTRLLFAASIVALLLLLGLVAMSRSQADDHTAAGVAATAPVAPSAATSNPSAPALLPLPPMQPPLNHVPVAPSSAASTSASDDIPRPTAAVSTNSPSITLPPPLQPSPQPPLSGTAQADTAPADTAPASLHVDVHALNDWALPSSANSTAKPTAKLPPPDPAIGQVTPASAVIPDSAASSAPPEIGGQLPDDLPESQPLQVEAAHFKEIEPGVTTSDELTQRWGEGKLLRKKDGVVQRLYTFGPYPQVKVSLEHRRVSAIDVQLDQPTEPNALAQRLHLDPDSRVSVLDDAGQPLGQSYPDHGTLFSYDPGTKLVSEMLLEPIDPQPFLLRAAHEADSHPGWCLRDVDYALGLDPAHAESHDMRSQILLAVGRPDDALKSANRSVALSPDHAAFLLNKAVALARLDHHAEAIQITQGVVDRTGSSALLKAHALCQLADLTAESTGKDQRAIELYMSAIHTAQPLASDQRMVVRRLAKHVLLEAHLGAANDIAWGVWQKKSVTVARWIEQADQLAQDLVAHEEADPQLRLDVARVAVSASAGTDGKWDAADWTQQALDIGRKLIAEADDPLRKESLEWELGAALVDALELQRSAGLNAQSLAHAMSVLRYLESGIQYRQRTSETLYIVGRTYFQIGVIHAVVEHDHSTAVLWFDRAVPLLDRPSPRSAVSRIGRNGELLVSMGISYWKTGNHEEALRLTQKGTDLMTKAVAMKLLNDNALAVPYGNLAAMYRQMGHSEQARSYSEMAAQRDTLHR